MSEDLKGKTQEELIKEFVKKLSLLESEEELIKESKKDLRDEYKEHLDMKTLVKAIQVVKIKERIQHKDTFDSIMLLLEKI